MIFLGQSLLKKISIYILIAIVIAMSIELKKTLKELVKYLEESNAPLELRKEGYKALGIVELLTSNPKRIPSYFDSARIFRGEDIPKYASFYAKYGPFSEIVPIILGNLALSARNPEEISEKTGMDKDFISEILEDILMGEGFVEPEGIEVKPIKYTLSLRK